MTAFDLPIGDLLAWGAVIVGAGIVAGLMAGIFGIGGGAVLVPVFYQLFGILEVDEAIRMHLSVGSSLAVIVPTSSRSFAGHYARGIVDMAFLRSMAIVVPAGVVLASLTAAYISGEGLRIIFAVWTLLIGMKLLFNRDSWRLKGDIPGNPVRAIVGVAIGYFSTLMGIGGGVMNNVFMTLFGRPMHQAVATSAGVGVLIAVPATAGYVWAGWNAPGLPVTSTGYVNWIAVGVIIPTTMLVTPYGVRIAHAMTKRQLELGFAIFCLLVSARFFWSLI